VNVLMVVSLFPNTRRWPLLLFCSIHEY
jgi:hypothetical protein